MDLLQDKFSVRTVGIRIDDETIYPVVRIRLKFIEHISGITVLKAVAGEFCNMRNSLIQKRMAPDDVVHISLVKSKRLELFLNLVWVDIMSYSINSYQVICVL